jgi:histidinol-phosphate aminotransferase
MMDFRPALSGLKPYSVEEKEWEVKLDANESPYNLPPVVRERVINRLSYLAFNRYPEMGMRDLRELIAANFGVATGNVVIGSGSSEILAALCLAFGGSGRGIVFPVPSFSMYSVYAQVADSKLVPVALAKDYSLPKEQVLTAAKENNGQLILLCNPNNPTGTATPLEDLEYIVSRAACPVVVDEAYYEFYGQSACSLLKTYKNLIIARTFSKAFGLASARVGYMLADEALTAVVNRVLMPYHVNALSLAVAEVVYQMRDEFAPLISQIVAERDRLIRILKAIPELTVFDSNTNFLLIKSAKTEKILKLLEQRGVGVRAFGGNPHLQNCIRITIGSPRENEKMVQCITEAVG